jgi:hypothetical protein
MVIDFLLWLMFIVVELFIMLENTESSLLEESLLLPQTVGAYVFRRF